MSRIELAPKVLADFDRILLHLADHEVEDAEGRIASISSAIEVLEHNPLIGRPAGSRNRELVIGRGSRGYVALYRYVEAIDTVLVLSIRAQREAGYS